MRSLIIAACLGLTFATSSYGEDIDNDGLDDRYDQCVDTPPNATINSHGCHFRYAGSMFSISFKAGSAWVEAEQTLILRDVAKSLAEIMSQFPGATVAVTGYQGGRKDNSVAENLSLLRAKAVARQLRLSRVPFKLMTVTGRGRAAVAGDPAAAQRVDILIKDWKPQHRHSYR
ncbi:MAG: OmpA family protein [Gammaproteobacteria bacterium]|nr:OmpA family protein [Gammaproteobacteria bacterium]